MKRTLFTIALLTIIASGAVGIASAQEESPTATAVPPTATAVPPTATAAPTVATTPSPARQAVVKRPIDGDSVEVVFTDNGQIATVHLANVNAPNALDELECFGRESAEYAAQAYQANPLISIQPVTEIKDGQLSAYLNLADGTLLNEMMVLFGYARYDGDGGGGLHASRIQAVQEQSKKGKAGLWRACGETEQASKPCYLFGRDEIDSASKRKFLVDHPDTTELSVWFVNSHYDPVQHEIVVLWGLSIDGWSSGWRMREYYRLSDCLRDRSTAYET